MEIVLWVAGSAVLLLLLVLVVARRRSTPGSPHQAHSPLAPPHGAPSASSWTFGGGGG